jgi:sulfate permease, SulP family
VPLVDVMGAEALRDMVERQRARGGEVLLTSLQPAARSMLARTGVLAVLGEHNIFWNAVEATVVAHGRHAQTGCQHCAGMEPLAVYDESHFATPERI